MNSVVNKYNDYVCRLYKMKVDDKDEIFIGKPVPFKSKTYRPLEMIIFRLNKPVTCIITCYLHYPDHEQC